jgi:hypothetical protein
MVRPSVRHRGARGPEDLLEREFLIRDAVRVLFHESQVQRAIAFTECRDQKRTGSPEEEDGRRDTNENGDADRAPFERRTVDPIIEFRGGRNSRQFTERTDHRPRPRQLQGAIGADRRMLRERIGPAIVELTDPPAEILAVHPATLRAAHAATVPLSGFGTRPSPGLFRDVPETPVETEFTPVQDTAARGS